jgi:hypothetical protein
VPIRPESERVLRAGFQRHVDEQNAKYAAQLAHAEQLRSWYQFGALVGVYTGPVGGGVKPVGYVAAYSPLAAIPFLIIAAASQVPCALPMLGAFPFAEGIWFGFCLWRFRDPKRAVWLYAFNDGFLLHKHPQADATPVRWNQIAEITQVWTDVYRHAAEDYRPQLTGYELRSADGQAYEFSRSLENVQDPYQQVGQLIRHFMPPSMAETMPSFPTIDELIARYAIPTPA